MKWFKHDTHSLTNAKIKKVIIKYGAIGYAIYFHCLELIANELSKSKSIFIKPNAELIANNLYITGNQEKSGKELVEEILQYMITLNLFEEHNGCFFCQKFSYLGITK